MYLFRHTAENCFVERNILVAGGKIQDLNPAGSLLSIGRLNSGRFLSFALRVAKIACIIGITLRAYGNETKTCHAIFARCRKTRRELIELRVPGLAKLNIPPCYLLPQLLAALVILLHKVQHLARNEFLGLGTMLTIDPQRQSPYFLLAGDCHDKSPSMTAINATMCKTSSTENSMSVLFFARPSVIVTP